MTLGRLACANGRKLAEIKDPLQEARLFSRRALIALAFVLAAILTLIGRLAHLQVINHDHFQTLSESNRVKIQPLPPTRGLIFDRNGVLLADNLSSHRLEVTPEQTDSLEATLDRLRGLIDISDEDIQRFHRTAKRRPPHSGIPLRFQLTQTEVARLAVNLHNLPGVEIKADLNRHYPRGAQAVHVIGYVGQINEQELQQADSGQYSGLSHIGKTGAEKAYEDVLRGQVGYQHVEINAHGRVLRVLSQTPPVPGRNIYLSIDMGLQGVAERALEAYNGAIVAIDPRTGEVLALASMPGYDPNPFVNGIDLASYQVLSRSPDRPLYNRALRGVYPPGSTIKPLMGLAGLESGTTSAQRTLRCPGFFRLPGSTHRFRDWKRGGHGSVNLDKAITQSCDVYFYDLAMHLGIDQIHEYLDHFSMGRPTGIDLPGEKTGLLPSKDWKRSVHKQPWYQGETVIIGIGQGYMLTTPLQLAYSTAILAARGQRLQPRILHATQSPDDLTIVLEALRTLPPVQVKNPDHWERVIAAMTHVVHGGGGTARRIGNDSAFLIAGKTGTAQVFSLGKNQRYNAKKLDKRLHDHALFIAFAPADKPRIAVAVIAEHGGGGSSTAAPIAKRVLDAYLLSPI